jgi:hypothetical protein
MGILGAGGSLIVWLVPGFGPLGPWGLAAFSIVVVGMAHRHRFKGRRWMHIDLFRHVTPAWASMEPGPDSA